MKHMKLHENQGLALAFLAPWRFQKAEPYPPKTLVPFVPSCDKQLVFYR